MAAGQATAGQSMKTHQMINKAVQEHKIPATSCAGADRPNWTRRSGM